MPVEPTVVPRGGSGPADPSDDLSSQTDDQAVETPDDDSASAEESDDSAKSGEQPTSPTALDRLAAEHGLDLRGKYKTDADLAKGFKELSGKLHERDEDAALGRVFKQHEAEFREYLSGKRSTPPEKSPPASPQLGVDEYLLLQSKVIDSKTGDLRADANAGDVTKFREAHAAIERNILAMGLGRMDAIEASVEKLIARREEQWQEQAQVHQARNADMQAVNEFYTENAGWLYQDGQSQVSGLKPEGEQFMALADQVYQEEIRTGRHNPNTGKGTPYSTMHEIAMARYLKQQRAPDRPGIKPQGKHKSTTISRAESTDARVDKMIEEGRSMTEVAAFLAEHET